MSEKASGALPEGDPLHAPGLKRRQRKEGEARYWLPRPKDIEAGYPLRSLTIPANASERECAALCRKYHADLLQWRSDADTGPESGTWLWAVWRYRHDPESRYREVGEHTREQYDYFCDLIETILGAHTIGSTTGADLVRWYKNFLAPAHEGGNPRLIRARGVMGQIRRVAKHALFLGHKPASGVLDLFEKGAITFQTPRARETAPSPAQVVSIANAALDAGYRSIAIATLAQFEFTERRVSIIGKYEAGRWAPGWVWDSVIDGVRQGITSSWTVTYYQNKKGRRRREYDLNDTPLLLELLCATPQEMRVGPVIVNEDTGLPWKRWDYARKFREIARAAGVPDNIWSMDMRAGGATESDSIAGLSMKDLKASGGWTTEQSAARYARGHIRAAQNVVKLRQKARASEA